MENLEQSSSKKFTKRVKEDIAYYLAYYTQVLGREIENFTVDLVDFGNDLLVDDLHEFFLRFVFDMKERKITIDDCLSNKDLFMDNAYKITEGSFFTPLGWAKKAQLLAIDKIGLEEFKDYNVWDCSCGSGNLVHGLPPHKKLFLSTLNAEDIPIVEKRYPEAEVFQLDFLGAYDSWLSYDLTSKLPSSLQQVLTNKEKLLIIINPPYATKGIDTVVGKYLQEIRETDLSLDLFRQFIWQVCNLVEIHGLDNVDFVLMVSNSLNQVTSGVTANRLLTNTFNYESGFVFPLNVFSGVLESSRRSVCCSYWWKRPNVAIEPRKEFYYDAYGTEELALKNQPDGYIYYPLEFNNGVGDYLRRGLNNQVKQKTYTPIDVVGKYLPERTKVQGPEDVLAWLSWRSDMMRLRDIMALRTYPTEARGIPITQGNFYNMCWYISYYLTEFSWLDRYYMRLEAPIENDFYNDVYKPNALLIALACRKNFTSGFRGVKTDDGVLDVSNALFFLEKNEVLAAIKENKTCSEELLHDFKTHWVDNSWLIKEIEYALSVSEKEIVELFQHVKKTLLNNLKTRVIEVNNPSSASYDLGLWQVRKLKSFDESYEEVYTELYAKMHVKRLELIRCLDFPSKHSLED